MARFPIDTEERKTGSRACAIVHYQLDSDHWVYREESEADVGRDCIIELSENDKWKNHKIECQIKGVRSIQRLDRMKLKNKNAYSFPLKKKTIMYALNSSTAFVLFFVDINTETAYYLAIQDYLIANKELFKKLESDNDDDDGDSTINVHISCDCVLSNLDDDLQEIAKSIYVDGPGSELRKHNT